MLTCKSLFGLGYRGERLIELSSSWFPPKCPPGQLELVSVLDAVHRLDGGRSPSGDLRYSRTLPRGSRVEDARRRAESHVG